MSLEVKVPVLSKHIVLSIPAYKVLEINMLVISLQFNLKRATAKVKLNKLPRKGGTAWANKDKTKNKIDFVWCYITIPNIAKNATKTIKAKAPWKVRAFL